MIQKYFHINANRNFSIAMIWINGGAYMDAVGKKGINQILCSLLNRGCKGFDNLKFSEYMLSHGAELNNEIFDDGILISLKSLDEHFEKLFPFLNLIINEPLLSKVEFQKVKNSSMNSIKKDRENPFNIAYEKWRKVVYLKHPYAYNCIGYETDISKITHKDILSEYEKFKNRDKYLISNNSDVNNQSLEFLNQKKSAITTNSQYSQCKNEKRFVSTHQKSNQTILMIGNQTCSQLDFEYLPLKILESHLSYGMSSVLFTLFREKNGLTYDVGVFNPIKREYSPFLIYLSVSNKNAILAFKILLQVWQEILSTCITKKALHLAKEKLKSSFLINNQSLDDILQRRIQLIGYNLNPNFDFDCLSKIEEINPRDIIKVTNKFFSKPILSVCGDKKICKDIENIWLKHY